MEIREGKLPETLWATPGLLGTPSPFTFIIIIIIITLLALQLICVCYVTLCTIYNYIIFIELKKSFRTFKNLFDSLGLPLLLPVSGYTQSSSCSRS